MRSSRPLFRIALVLLVLGGFSCATPTEKANFNAFLEQIARDCNPLVIGPDNFSQAITFNGLGAEPENYNVFLSKTEALFNGGIPPDLYARSITSFIGSGTANDRSFRCIFDHLPKK